MLRCATMIAWLPYTIYIDLRSCNKKRMHVIESKSKRNADHTTTRQKRKKEAK